MPYKIVPTRAFLRQAKKLSKKYLSLKGELAQLFTDLIENPLLGTPLGNNCYKIRLAIQSKGKGKSGGVRVITYLISEDKEIYTIDIYDKSERETIKDKELEKLIKSLQNE